MAHIFQCNVFQQSVFQNACTVQIPTPPPAAGGAGSVYGRAFPAKRRLRDLYKPLRPKPQEVGTISEQEIPPAVSIGPSPLPMFMDFGAGPVNIGIRAPSLKEAIERQILADDEDAIAAILFAAS